MPNLQMDNTYAFFETLEPKLVKQMQDILMKYNRNASYKLYNSIEIDLTANQKGFLFKMTYADHGKYVLDSRRRLHAQKPSYNKTNPLDPRTAIGALSQWILNKGISVGGGRIRTPLSKSESAGGKYDLAPKTEASRKNTMNKNPELTSFAFAIWYNIRKHGRIKTEPTNFLKPYQNLWTDNNFRRDLNTALKADGILLLKTSMVNSQIKIKM